MKKAKLHGVPQPDPIKHPIIEITGVPDCGKKLIARELAKRIGGYFILAPQLNADSFTGRALIHSLTHNARELESEPVWWCHIYAAHLLEIKHQIEHYRQYGPVVVTNYTEGFSIWARAMGLKKLPGFLKDLPVPQLIFGLYGRNIETPGNVKALFSGEFISKLYFHTAKRQSPKYHKIKMLHFQQDYESINQVIMDISEITKLKLGLKIDEGHLVTSTLM